MFRGRGGALRRSRVEADAQSPADEPRGQPVLKSGLESVCATVGGKPCILRAVRPIAGTPPRLKSVLADPYRRMSVPKPSLIAATPNGSAGPDETIAQHARGPGDSVLKAVRIEPPITWGPDKDSAARQMTAPHNLSPARCRSCFQHAANPFPPQATLTLRIEAPNAEWHPTS